ncbi:MAG: cysteine hydrolase [bacterium]|nr:cysteine hydrolase [bacterium]
MREAISRKTALLIIDVQQGFDNPKWGERNNPGAEAVIADLTALWRQENRPVIHIQHCSTETDSSLHPDHPGCQFKPESIPADGEPVFKKSVHSAFIGTGLESYLHENEIDTLVIAGFTTDQCVSTTTRMAGNLGFDVYLIADAAATFGKIGYSGREYTAEEVHDIHLASIDEEFCEVISSDELLK